MSTKSILKVISIAMGLSGIAFVCIGAGWMAAIGLFLALWASTIESLYLRSPTTQAGGGSNNSGS